MHADVGRLEEELTAEGALLAQGQLAHVAVEGQGAIEVPHEHRDGMHSCDRDRGRSDGDLGVRPGGRGSGGQDGEPESGSG
jgi:hypothetical protein